MSKIYISCQIRGKFGNKATKEYMEANNKKARDFGRFLRENFGPHVFYIPAELDDFLWDRDIDPIKMKHILDFDCDIISQYNGVLFYMPDDYLSGGMEIEKMYAEAHGKPQLNVGSELLKYNERLKFAIANWLERI
jgi:hypothetical protein